MTLETCRICLGEEFLTSIFQERGSSCISNEINNLAIINITPNDGLPDKICSTCIKKLDDCTEFIQLCQNSDAKLRSIKTEDRLVPDFEPDDSKEEENFIQCNVDENEPDNRATEVTNKQKNYNKIKGAKSDGKRKSFKPQCFTCGKVMSSRFRLKTHLRTHTGERPFTCSHCNKTFTLEQNLKVHLRTHTGEKPLHCAVCGASFAHSAGLAAHARSHSGAAPYGCALCPRAFRTHGHLQYHVRRHTGEKNFECETCYKAFITRSGLKQHQLTHSGDKPHACTVCGKRMSRASHVKRHVRLAHGDGNTDIDSTKCNNKNLTAKE